jgi:hypothetical protein
VYVCMQCHAHLLQISSKLYRWMALGYFSHIFSGDVVLNIQYTELLFSTKQIDKKVYIMA